MARQLERWEKKRIIDGFNSCWLARCHAIENVVAYELHDLYHKVVKCAELDHDDDVRLTAVRALGTIGTAQTIAVLERIIRHDHDGEVRDMATASLETLRQKFGTGTTEEPKSIVQRLFQRT